MKDAKGHGSNPGAHASGIVKAVEPKMTAAGFAEMVAESRARSHEADRYLGEVLRTNQAVFENGNRKMLISKSLDPNYDLRATDFDERGPSGHREYKRGDLRGLKDEIFQALAGGYKLKAKK